MKLQYKIYFNKISTFCGICNEFLSFGLIKSAYCNNCKFKHRSTFVIINKYKIIIPPIRNNNKNIKQDFYNIN